MTATVGDFLTAAAAHLDAAGAVDVHRLDTRASVELADALAAAIRAAQRLASGPPALFGAAEAGSHPARAMATRAVRAAYARATTALPHALDRPDPRSPAAAHVLAAATNLGVATDLLATHSVSIPGALLPLSDTAMALDTPAARWSLVGTAAAYAGPLADLTRRSALAQAGADPARGHALLAAHVALIDAAAAIPPTLRQAVPGVGLEAIRPLPFPRSEPPRPTDSPAQNLHRAANLAYQLHTRAYRDGPIGAAPTAHSPGVLMAAAAAAVTAHRAAGSILYTLAAPDTDTDRSLSTLTREAMRATADQITQAGRHWKDVHQAWSGVRTALEIPPTAAVMQDVINLANCARTAAYQEAGRSGARPGQVPRPAGALLIDDSSLSDVATALHKLLVAFPGLAQEHARLAEGLSRRGQLLVRTSTLVEESPLGPARHYCRAPRPTATALSTAYADARDRGTGTADMLSSRVCGIVLARARAEPLVVRNGTQPARSRN